MLYLIATPIGNLSDMSLRGIEVLKNVDIIACEDTRRTRGLLTHFGIKYPMAMVSYHEHNEENAGKRLLEYLKKDLNVAFCSDGGYPAVSDPGYRLVKLAIENNIKIEIIPGPSAVLMGIVLSGLPTSSFTFKGYPPRRHGPLHRFFEDEKNMPHTLIFFESPHRIKQTIEVALMVLGNRYAALCVEMTKKFERVIRGNLALILDICKENRIQGEITVVIAGNNPKFMDKAESAY